MGKSSIQPPVGEVVLVQKKPEPVAEQPKIREISQKQYEKLRPKKELSEKQKENLAKLVEKNKQRALERRAVVKEVPETVPEDKELVIVKPKRKYVRKPKNEVIVPSESEPETATESESEVEVRKPLPLKRVNTPKPKKKATPKKPTKYTYETETTSQEEWSDDDRSSDDDYEEKKVQKYKAKAHARLQAVQEIDKRMSHIQNNPYANRGLSIF
jgi:hypothetical protein